MENLNPTKQVYMIHGWGAFAPWFPAIQKLCEDSGCDVHILKMPSPWLPDLNKWVSKLKEILSLPNEDTYFLGYSCGALTALRYLEDLEPHQSANGLVLVAVFSPYIIFPWLPSLLTRKLRYDKIKSKFKNLCVVQSSNDIRAPVINGKLLADSVGGTLLASLKERHFDLTSIPTNEIIQAVQEVIIGITVKDTA